MVPPLRGRRAADGAEEKTGHSGQDDRVLACEEFECGWRVSEWGTGLELMQEWKFGLEGKGCVCMEI